MDHKRRIALIAVHGVGHQQPRDSAQRAADLLRNQCEGYDWLRQSMVRIPVEAVSTGLLGYQPRAADTTYATTCIELKRIDGSECHVFEMFWGDLSRQQKKIIGTVVEFYQLLFFLSDLGGRVIHHARAGYARSNAWWAFDWAHRLAHLLLVL